MHGRAAIGGREHEDAGFASMGCDRFAEVGRRSGEIRVRPQDAEAGAGHCTQAVASVVADEVVLPVSKEGEVVVGYPSEHVCRLGGLVHGDTRGRMLVEVVGSLQSLAAHARPVLDRLAYVAEDAPQRGFDLRGGHPAPADLGVNPGLAYACPIRGDALKRSRDVTLSCEDGMNHQAERTSEPRQLGGDRVDEEGHVIGDDLHDWPPARPPVGVIGRRMYAHARRARRALTAQIDVGDHRTQEVRRSTRLEVLLRHMPVVERGELLKKGAARRHVLYFAQDCTRVVPMGQRHGRRLLQPLARVGQPARSALLEGRPARPK